ncbi:MAG: UDP binding domain-containing protein, partial [bacterium]
EYGSNVDTYDPWANPEEAEAEYNIRLIREPAPGKYDAIVLAVGHNQFKEMGSDRIRSFGRRECVVYDIKSILPYKAFDGRL